MSQNHAKNSPIISKARPPKTVTHMKRSTKNQSATPETGKGELDPPISPRCITRKLENKKNPPSPSPPSRRRRSVLIPAPHAYEARCKRLDNRTEENRGHLPSVPAAGEWRSVSGSFGLGLQDNNNISPPARCAPHASNNEIGKRDGSRTKLATGDADE